MNSRILSETCQIHTFHTGRKFLWHVRNRLHTKNRQGRGWWIPNNVIHTGHWIGNKGQETCMVKVSPNLQENKYSYSLPFTYIHLLVLKPTNPEGHFLTLAGIRAASTVKQLTHEAITSTGGEMTVVSLQKRNGINQMHRDLAYRLLC